MLQTILSIRKLLATAKNDEVSNNYDKTIIDDNQNKARRLSNALKQLMTAINYLIYNANKAFI